MIPRRKIHTINRECYLALKTFFKKNVCFSEGIPELEKAFSRFIDVKHAIPVSSGRMGMKLILESLELNKADEVIIPAYTLKDLINLIQSLGLIPVPADIHPETFNIDPNSVAQRITNKTRVILATHLFGTPCQIDNIMQIARDKSIFVIEDCAHSIGAQFNGRKTGCFGDASFFSFETIKPVNAYGGGMVVTNDEGLARQIRQKIIYCENTSRIPIKKVMGAFLENLILPTPLSFPALYLLASEPWDKIMYNFYRKIQKSAGQIHPLTDFQAFIGLEKLKTLESRIFQRRKRADLFKILLKDKIRPQLIEDKISPNYYFFVALIPSGDVFKIRKFLLMHGIDAGVGAEIADDCATFLKRADCLNAQEVFRQVIHLPLHEGMSEHQIRYMAGVLGRLFP